MVVTILATINFTVHSIDMPILLESSLSA